MDYYTLKNSIWPNGIKKDDEGYNIFYPLGTNKVDISTVTWPEGDKLVSPFVYQDDKLVGFVDTKALIVSGSATTTMNYSHIEADFSSISEGKLTVNAPNAIVKKFTWSVVDSGDDSGDDNVIVTLKYKGCKTTDDVEEVDRNYKTTDIVDGVWSEGLGDLTNGYDMFSGCDELVSFTSDLSSLTNGYYMFSASGLTSFTTNLPSLTDGDHMFHMCAALTTFSSNLSKMTNGKTMFFNCENLTSFNSDLSSLTTGSSMFYWCKLDAPSVKNIIDTINTYSGYLDLGMGCDNTTADKDLFAQEIGYANMASLLAAFEAKKWRVGAQYNGRPTTTYGLRRPSDDTLPVFVKLEEVEEAEEHADYTSEDGSKKYRLYWFHETTGSTEGYTQYATLEEAVVHFNIKPLERN